MKIEDNVIISNERSLKIWEKSILYELPFFKYCKGDLKPVNVAIYSSRDSSIVNCMNRLESNENSHARHLLIDKSGRAIQYAPFNVAIRHIRGRSPINNSNTIAIELCCDGRLIPVLNNRSVSFVSRSGISYKTSHKNHNDGRYYDQISSVQKMKLKKVLSCLENEYGKLDLKDGGDFRDSSDYRIFPLLNIS